MMYAIESLFTIATINTVIEKFEEADKELPIFISAEETDVDLYKIQQALGIFATKIMLQGNLIDAVIAAPKIYERANKGVEDKDMAARAFIAHELGHHICGHIYIKDAVHGAAAGPEILINNGSEMEADQFAVDLGLGPALKYALEQFYNKTNDESIKKRIDVL